MIYQLEFSGQAIKDIDFHKKSGGDTGITYTKIVDGIVYLLDIYSKSEKENISKKELHKLLLNLR